MRSTGEAVPKIRPTAVAAATALTTALMLAASASFAATLASAVLLSTNAQTIDCFLSNVGTQPVLLGGVSMQNGGNTLLSLSVNSCSNSLAPGGNCTFSAGLDSRFSARGLVQVRGSTRSLRGQCQLTTSSNQIVATTELR